MTQCLIQVVSETVSKYADRSQTLRGTVEVNLFGYINSQLPKVPITPVNARRLLIKFLIFPVLGCVWYLWTIAIIATKLIENVSTFSFLIQNILLHEVILDQCKQGITVSTAYRCNNIHLFHRCIVYYLITHWHYMSMIFFLHHKNTFAQNRTQRNKRSSLPSPSSRPQSPSSSSFIPHPPALESPNHTPWPLNLWKEHYKKIQHEFKKTTQIALYTFMSL